MINNLPKILISYLVEERGTRPTEVVVVSHTGQSAHVLIPSQSGINPPPPDFNSVIEFPPPSYQDHRKDPKITQAVANTA